MGIVADIRKKRELRGLQEAVVEKELQKVLKQHPAWREALPNPRSAGYRQIMKLVRANLRSNYGLFRPAKLPLDVDFVNKAAVRELLGAHVSTGERLPFYGKLYKEIFRVTGVPLTILDLGCGLNPLSLPFMGLRKLQYHAYDISEGEVRVLNSFFESVRGKNNLIQGKAEVQDISDVNAVRAMPPAEICFLFKVADIIDRGQGHKRTEELMDAIPARYVVISFSTRTMSGKPMTAPRRRWMEWLCRRRGWKYEILEFENEVVYVVRKERES